MTQVVRSSKRRELVSIFSLNSNCIYKIYYVTRLGISRYGENRTTKKW